MPVALAALLLLVTSAGVIHSAQERIGIKSLATTGPDSILVERIRQRPDEARDALRDVLSAVATTVETSRLPALASAERVAAAYAVAWRDSFLVREVSRFRSLSPSNRRARIAADSLRRTGNETLGRDGVGAAMRLWRESLRRFEVLADTAGIAAAIGNIGAGFYLAQEYDSAEVYLERSRILATRMGDHRTAGNAVGTLASVSKDRGNLRRASDLYTLASGIREKTGDARGMAADQNNLGLISQALGDFDGAREAFRSALAANRRGDRPAQAATNQVNLGNLASLEGEYATALTHYSEALAIFRDRGQDVDAAFVLHNLGLLALRRGEYPAAVAALSEAADTYGRTGPPADRVAVWQDLSRARAAMGDLQGARAQLQRAERLASRGQVNEEIVATLALARADLAVQFNQLIEAEAHYGRANRVGRGSGQATVRAAAQEGIGRVWLMRGNYSRARAALVLAARAQDASGDRRAAALTRLLLGYAEQQNGDTAAAGRVFRLALDTLQLLRDPVGEAAALAGLGDLQAQAGLPLAAESLFQLGLTRLGTRATPDVAWQLHAGMARALRSRGALAESARQFRLAIGQIERVAGALAVEERRAAFLSDKWQVFNDLALVEQSRGRPESAFEASERLRARQMLDLLARGRVAPAGELAGAWAVREQDLRRRIAELTSRLESAEGGGPDLRGPSLDGRTSATTREALARAQDAYGELLLEMREAQPKYAALVRGDIASAHDVRLALAPAEALIEYLVGDSTTLAFVITRDTVAVLDLNLTRDALAPLVDFARGTLAAPTASATRRAWRAPLRRLFQYLFAPVEASGLLAGKQRLIIAPHAELHYLPFAALVRSGPPDQLLVERYFLEYVPSASAWLQLRRRQKPPAQNGVLALAPRAGALPGSRMEVASVGRIHGGRARVLVGSAASERAFRSLAPEQGIIHLATYGVLNKHNPLFSFVELGAGGGDDGRLEVHEVFGLALNVRLLVLSACQTGLAVGALADVPSGDDWVGLVQAFLFAGASNVLATLWPVEDQSTARLMERFHQSLASGRPEVEALTEAQRAAARDPATAHPFFWAGFVLVRGQ